MDQQINEYKTLSCPKCRGKGWIYIGVKDYECDECDGWGDVNRLIDKKEESTV